MTDIKTVGRMTFDQEKLRTFKAVYDQTVSAGRTSFKFEGQGFDTGYAKYLIEYLEKVFKGT